jgi:hypothetical protein
MSKFQNFATIRSLPAPSDGQQFSDLSIELAPGHSFSGVYVATLPEREGNFQDFYRFVLDPAAAFPSQIIPAFVLPGIYTFRVGPAAARPLSLLGAAVFAIRLLLRKQAKITHPLT